nr:MAG TPA: helix-turn-helix domain protein [Caudoviricetes sp.]
MNRIKAAREAAGLTQAEVYEVLRIPMRTLQDWENERRTPPEWAELLIIEKLEQIKEKKTMTYEVQVSTIESGWETVYEGTKEACLAEYQNQLEVDKEEGTTNFATQVVDGFGKVIAEHKGDDYYAR